MIETDVGLTRIYDSIKTYKAVHGYSPNQDEIAAELGMTKAQIAQAMEAMETLGMIVQPRGLLRAIKLLSRQPNENRVTTNPVSELYPSDHHS